MNRQPQKKYEPDKKSCKIIQRSELPIRGIKHLLISRVAVIAIILLTQATAEIARGHTGNYMNLDGSTRIHHAIIPSNNLLKADIGWYKRIVDFGYTKEPFKANGSPESQRNWAFFPGWPIFWKLGGLGKAKAATGMIIANFLFIGGMAGMGAYLIRSGLTNRSTTGSFFLLASYYPFGYFFSLPLPESLFGACTAFFLLSIPKSRSGTDQTILNCIFGYASGLTRPTGIFNSIFPVAEIIKSFIRRDLNPRSLANLLASALSPFLGLGSFMIYLYHQTGNPFAFKDIQVAWGRSSGVILEGLAKALSPSEIGMLTHYSNFRLANLIICLAMAACSFILLKKALTRGSNEKHEINFEFLAIATYLICLIFSCSSDNQALLSFSRIAGANPIFFAALAICVKPFIVREIAPALAIFLGAFSALATIGFDAFAA